jgi:hypothetical protein
MNRILMLFALSIAILFISCAYTQSDLNVAYNLDNAKRGPLSSLKALNIEIAEFMDKRPERDSIGYKRDGFGNKGGKIVTKKPVPQIVREALLAEFKKNRHRIVSSDQADVYLSGRINTFFFDMQTGWTIEFVGMVGIDLVVTNSKTKEVLLTRTYQGSYSEKCLAGLEGTWERVMSKALERMVRQVSIDHRLVRALRSI